MDIEGHKDGEVIDDFGKLVSAARGFGIGEEVLIVDEKDGKRHKIRFIFRNNEWEGGHFVLFHDRFMGYAISAIRKIDKQQSSISA